MAAFCSASCTHAAPCWSVGCLEGGGSGRPVGVTRCDLFFQNVVNIYKSQGAKVMPQPLVLHFAVCMLHMVEQLHAAHIVHADIKPDNFMLGDRYQLQSSSSKHSEYLLGMTLSYHHI